MALLSRSVSPRCRPSIRLSVSSSFLFFLFLLYLHSFSKTTSFYICLKIKLTSHKSQERIPQGSTSQSILHINIFSYTFHTNIDLKLEKNESNSSNQILRSKSSKEVGRTPPPAWSCAHRRGRPRVVAGSHARAAGIPHLARTCAVVGRSGTAHSAAGPDCAPRRSRPRAACRPAATAVAQACPPASTLQEEIEVGEIQGMRRDKILERE